MFSLKNGKKELKGQEMGYKKKPVFALCPWNELNRPLPKAKRSHPSLARPNQNQPLPPLTMKARVSR